MACFQLLADSSAHKFELKIHTAPLDLAVLAKWKDPIFHVTCLSAVFTSTMVTIAS